VFEDSAKCVSAYIRDLFETPEVTEVFSISTTPSTGCQVLDS